MPNEKIKEIVDFATSESPYRSANKGWITDQIYLNFGSSKAESIKGLDRIVKVSINSKPIIQILWLVFIIAFISLVLAFTPISLARGGLHSVVALRKQTSPIETNVPKVEKTIQIEENSIEKTANLNKSNDDVIVQPIRNKSVSLSLQEDTKSKEINVENFTSKIPIEPRKKISPTSVTRRKLVTATDLFQPKR